MPPSSSLETVNGDEVTDLLAAFQRLDPIHKALAIRLLRTIPG